MKMSWSHSSTGGARCGLESGLDTSGMNGAAIVLASALWLLKVGVYMGNEAAEQSPELYL